MFTRALVAAAVVAGAFAAPNGAKPTSCNAPVVKVQDVTAFSRSKMCTPLAGGPSAVTNVAYEVNSMFGCRGPTTIWCNGNVVVDKREKRCTSKYWYCCGKDCQGAPKPRYCEYKGVKYTVGVAYDLGSMTLWCVDEKKVVTCEGKKCGSCLELTPPGPSKCKPPVPQYECKRDSDCRKVNGVAFQCKKNKCVPAEGPQPDQNGVCHWDRDCPKVNGLAFACKNNKCVPAEGPSTECRRSSDCNCPFGLACECKNGQCVPVLGEPQPECRRSSDCHCPFGLACVCQNNKCVPSAAGVN